MLDPGEEFPTDDVQGDSVKLAPRKLGLITGIDVEAIEDADVNTLDVVGQSLARAIAAKLDAPVQHRSRRQGACRSAGHVHPARRGARRDSAAQAVAMIQAEGGSPDTIYISPADMVDLRTEPVETGGKLPLLGVDVSQAGAKTVDGLALRVCPALPAGKAVVAEARQIIIGIGRHINVVASSEAKFTSDVVLVKSSVRADFKINDPLGVVLVGT